MLVAIVDYFPTTLKLFFSCACELAARKFHLTRCFYCNNENIIRFLFIKSRSRKFYTLFLTVFFMNAIATLRMMATDLTGC